jgi:ubiquinone/menaquinone biosynthesis C-methylase UbiE
MARLIARELMDDEAASGELAEWRGSLHDLARVNSLLGGRRLMRLEIDRLPALPKTVLDVGTGGADMPVFVLDYLRERGVAATCVAVDRSPRILAIAAERLGNRTDVRLQTADATALPFSDGSFDLAMMNLALHHFDGAKAVQVLGELARVARTAIVNDLRRSGVAWAFARFVFPFFTRNRFTLNDGPLSIRRAYTPAEARDLATSAGWTSIEVRKHAGYRMALVGGRS